VAPGGVASKNGYSRGICAYRRGSFPIAHDACLCVCLCVCRHYTNTEALCAAPPEAHPRSPSQMPLSCPVAPQAARSCKSYRQPRIPPRRHAPRKTSPRRRAVDLQVIQATEPSPTPSRTEKHITTTPGCGPAGRRAFAHADTPNISPGCRPRRAAEVNFARRRAPLDHSDARGGAPRRDAGLQTSRPRRPLAHADARGGIPRRDAGLQTSRPRRPLAHADARGGIPRRDAGLQTSRSRRQSAR